MTSTGRINYIDELKGFILCLVCLGHIAYSELSYVMNWMSLMRMFTFFFLSGLLFSRRRFKTFTFPLHLVIIVFSYNNFSNLCWSY